MALPRIPRSPSRQGPCCCAGAAHAGRVGGWMGGGLTLLKRVMALANWPVGYTKRGGDVAYGGRDAERESAAAGTLQGDPQKQEFVRATAVRLTPLLELETIVVAVRVLDEIGVRVAALHCDRWVKRTRKRRGREVFVLVVEALRLKNCRRQGEFLIKVAWTLEMSATMSSAKSRRVRIAPTGPFAMHPRPCPCQFAARGPLELGVIPPTQASSQSRRPSRCRFLSPACNSPPPVPSGHPGTGSAVREDTAHARRRQCWAARKLRPVARGKASAASCAAVLE